MKEATVKKLFIVCFMAVMLLGIVACSGEKYDQGRFTVELSSGYGDKVQVGTYAPFWLEVTNNGEDFEGAVQIIVPGRENHNVMYQKELSIQKGTTKTVELVGYIDMITRYVNVRVMDNHDNVIWASQLNCSTLADLKNVNVGIISDDYSALGYMDQQTFMASGLTTQIYELTRDTFPTDWRALDMLDVVVISDYSTDMLSEEQINALSLWVNDGGLLMVGTGSTANKTLAGLNGTVFQIKTGDLNSQNTKFGLSVANYSYDYGIQDDYYYYAGDDTLYTQFFEENYDAMREDLIVEYLDDFERYWGYGSYEDGDYTWDEYIEEEFYYYCYEEFYDIYRETLGEETVSVPSEAYSYVTADVLEMSGGKLDAANNSYGGTEIFWGENSNGDVYELAYAFEQGKGHVLLSGIDFTKNPFSSYEGNSLLFVHWVETLIGQHCYQESLDYSNYTSGYFNSSMDYSEEEIWSGTASATVPPILLYIVILLLYLVAILVLYLVMRHKKKSMRLWIIYPLVAVGLSVLIFCIGFSTRIYRPVINAITLINPNGGASIERTYARVTVPRQKAYEIGFSAEQAVEIHEDNYYYYDGSDEIDLNVYDVGYIMSYGTVAVQMGEIGAMGSKEFLMEAVRPTEQSVTVGSTDGTTDGLYVTNEYGCDLENALLIVDGYEYYHLGDIPNGATIHFNQMREETELSLYSDGLGTIMLQNESPVTKAMGVILGSISGTYDEYLCELRALNSLTDYVDRYEGPDVVFVALPADDAATPLQASTDYTERRVEIIFVEYDLKGMGMPSYGY